MIFVKDLKETKVGDKVMIYGRHHCPFCVQARAFCESHGVLFEYVDMTGDLNTQEDVFSRSNGMRTVPQIFIGDKHIGGFSDMESLHKDGGFLPLCLRNE